MDTVQIRGPSLVASPMVYQQFPSPLPRCSSICDGEIHKLCPLCPQVTGSPMDSTQSWNQAPRPMSGQGTVASSFSETITYLRGPDEALMWFRGPGSAYSTLTYPTYQGTWPPPAYNRNLSLPSRPAEIYTPFPPHRTLKDRYSDITAFPMSELTV